MLDSKLWFYAGHRCGTLDPGLGAYAALARGDTVILGLVSRALTKCFYFEEGEIKYSIYLRRERKCGSIRA